MYAHLRFGPYRVCVAINDHVADFACRASLTWGCWSLGAGVTGSFTAARLAAAGVDVRLLAGGQRLAALREHSVILQDWRTGRRSVTLVDLVEAIEPAARYDVAVVIVRRNQVASVLALVAAAPRIPACVFLGNNLAGSADMAAAALGGDRVRTGMVNAGGERDGVGVRYLWTRRLPLLFGERDGVTRPRTRAIAEMFCDAGLPANGNLSCCAVLAWRK